MDKGAIEKRIEELRGLIAKADHAYYDLHAPTVGDADYDAWEMELLRLEAENPEFAKEQQVSGGVTEGFAKVTHNPPMQSLDKTHAKSELLAFDAFLRREIVAKTYALTLIEPITIKHVLMGRVKHLNTHELLQIVGVSIL